MGRIQVGSSTSTTGQGIVLGKQGISFGYSAASLPPVVNPITLSLNTISAGQINLSWTSVTNFGFSIERSLDGISFVEIAIVGADVLSYSDTSVGYSTTYYYKVRAFTTAVEPFTYSGYSNTANTTTASFAFDADVSTFIAAVETADGSEVRRSRKMAFNALVVALKANGFSAGTTGCQFAYIPLAETLSGSLIPFINNGSYTTSPMTNVNYISTDWDIQYGWFKNDQVSKYLQSGFIMQAPITDQNASMIYNASYAGFWAPWYLAGAIDASSLHTFKISKNGPSSAVSNFFTSSSIQVNNQTDVYERHMDHRIINGTNQKIWRNNGVTINTTTSAGGTAKPSTEMYINAYNNNGTVNSNTVPGTMYYLLIGTVLTIVQLDNIKSAFSTYTQAIKNEK